MWFLVMFYTTFDAFVYFGPVNTVVKCVFYLLFFYSLINNYFFRISTFLLMFLLVSSFIINFVITPASFNINLKSFVRILNPFLIYISFSYIEKKRELFSMNSFVFFLRVFYISVYASLILGKVTDVGLVNRLGQIAFKGFFKGTNEIGLLLIIILIYLFFLKDNLKKKEIFSILSLNIICGYFVFTKSSLVASFVAFFLMFYFFRGFRYICVCLLFFLSFVSFFKETALTKAIKNILDNSIYFKMLSSSFVHFIFNSREIYFQSFFNHFEFNVLSFFHLMFTGLGDYGVISCILPGLSWIEETNINVVGRASFEMDFFDLFFGYGVLFTCIYLYYIYRYLYVVGRNSFFIVKLLFLFILVHSALAGHVLYSTQITGPLVFLYFFVTTNKFSINFKGIK